MSLVTRIKATGLPKDQLKVCNMLNRDDLVEIANEMGFDTKGKRQGTLCNHILVQIASNPRKYGKYLDRIAHIYDSHNVKWGGFPVSRKYTSKTVFVDPYTYPLRK